MAKRGCHEVAFFVYFFKIGLGVMLERYACIGTCIGMARQMLESSFGSRQMP